MSLGRQMASGAVWMVAARLCERLIGIVSTIVLARLLLPADFGLVSMAMSAIAMLEALSTFSLDVALIQNQQAERRHYDTAWTFNVLLGVSSALMVLVLASSASRFFGEPRLLPLVSCLAALPLVSGFENVGIVEFRKQLEFGKEFRFLFAKKLTSFVVLVPLAVVLRNYWALVVGMVAGRVAGVVLTYVLQPYRPRLSLSARHELFNFSKWLVVNNITEFLLHRAPDLIIGKVAGAGPLGLFNLSHEIAYMPSNELVAPINRAVFPGYAKKSGNVQTLGQGFLDVMSVIGLIMIPSAAGVFLTADALVPVVLGDHWVGAQPLIRPLAIAGLLFAFQTNPTYVYFALGNPGVVTLLTVLYVALLQPMMILATRSAGPLGAAWAYVGTAAIVLPITYSILFRKLNLRPKSLFSRLWRPLVATGVMSVAVRSIMQTLPHGRGTGIGGLALLVFTGVVVYTICIAALWILCSAREGGERFIWEWSSQKLSGWRSRSRKD